jgi:transposase
MAKRLEGGQFRWPAIEDGMMQLTPAQLATLLEGLEWRHIEPRNVVRPSATQ